MKVCVCGKGGTGKSTVVTLLAHELARRGRELVIIDTDESNAGLSRMLGLRHSPRPLIELAGGKKKVMPLMRGKPVVSAIPEDKTGILMQPEIRVADLPPEFATCNQGCCLIVVGKIHQALEGCACPMGVLTREFLKRLHLSADEMAIVDMEAGIEHFGRGIETSVDAVIAVVEPSFESIATAERIKELATGAGARFAGAIVNKVPTGEMERHVVSELKTRNIDMLGVIHHHQEIAEAALTGQTLKGLKCADGAAYAAEIMPIVDALEEVAPSEQHATATRGVRR